RLAHPFEHRVGHGYAGDFVVQKLGVAVTDQRPDARDDRDATVFDALEEGFQLLGVEDRLRDGVFRSGFDLPFKAADLVIQVDRAGIDAYADDKLRRLADRVSARIQSVIQAVDQVGQSDRVNVEDGRGVRVRPHLRRVAGNDQEVAQAKRRRAQQV